MDMKMLQQMMQAQQAGNEADKPLLEFRCGVLNKRGNMLHADPRKGLLSMNVEADKRLHIRWKLRPSEEKVLDLVIPKEGATVERIDECKDGRVLVLVYKNSTRRQFFWLQEPETDKDEQFLKTIQDTIDDPPERASTGPSGATAQQQELMRQMMQGRGGGGGRSGAGGGGGGGQMSEEAMLQRALAESVRATGGGGGGMGGGDDDLARALAASAAEFQQAQAQNAVSASNAAPATSNTSSSTTTTTNSNTNTTTPTMSQANMDLLRNMMMQASQQQQVQNQGPRLENIITSEKVYPLLLDQKDSKEVQALIALLPPELVSGGLDEVKRTLESPQLQQTLQRFTSILNGPEYGGLVASLGLANSGDMGVKAFIEAVIKLVQDEKASSSSS